jgi:hypothetical protein
MDIDALRRSQTGWKYHFAANLGSREEFGIRASLKLILVIPRLAIWRRGEADIRSL